MVYAYVDVLNIFISIDEIASYIQLCSVPQVPTCNHIQGLRGARRHAPANPNDTHGSACETPTWNRCPVGQLANPHLAS